MKSRLRVLPYVALLLPLDVLVAVGIGLASICAFVASRSKKQQGAKARTLGSKAPIGLVTWDGKHLLGECLPPVVQAVNHAGGCHEIMVVDNGSTDVSLELLKTEF